MPRELDKADAVAVGSGKGDWLSRKQERDDDDFEKLGDADGVATRAGIDCDKGLENDTLFLCFNEERLSPSSSELTKNLFFFDLENS